MNNAFKQETKSVISVNDWDNLVKSHYGKQIYSFQQQDDCRDRGDYDFDVSFIDHDEFYTNSTVPVEVNGEVMGVSLQSWINRNKPFFGDKVDERLFWERNFYPSPEEIILDLHKKGIVPKEFTIKVDW